MSRIAAAATAAAFALLVPAAPAYAVETTTVHYSGEFFADIVVIYRPRLPLPDVSEVVEGVTKAECTFDATGTSQSGVYGTFVAKIATTAPTQNNQWPQDNLPVATGVFCSVNGGGYFEWTAVRPGVAAADARSERLDGVITRPEICVRGWVIYSNGYQRDYPMECRTP